MPRTPVKKSHTLARVRNNQRRCRARRRDYIAQLEKKVQDLEASGAPAEESTVKCLEDENKKLRHLLGLAGFTEAWVEAYVVQEKANGETAIQFPASGEGNLPQPQHEANDYLEMVFGAMTTDVMPEMWGSGSSTALGGGLFDVPLELPGDEFNFFVPSPTLSPVDEPPTLMSSEGRSDESSCCSEQSTIPSTLTSFPQAPSVIDPSLLKSTIPGSEDTTLCSVAYSLVRQHNKKGVEMVEIGIRLWNGFIKGGQDGGGCRVDNKLLLSVLEYISR